MTMDQEFLRRLEEEKSLSAQESFELDQALDDQAVVRSLIQDLDEEGADLVWRSQLNERLLSVTPLAKAQPRWRIVRIWAPVAAGVAGMAFLGVMLAKPKTGGVALPISTTSQELEREMLATHLGSGISNEYHSGLSAEPTGKPIDAQAPSWTSEDLELF